MLVPSWLVPVVLRLTRRNQPYVTAEGARRRVDERVANPASFDPPPLGDAVDVAVRHDDGWPIFTLSPTGTTPTGNVVYLHGGAWVNEIVRQQWQLAAQIAIEANTTVAVPIYPLVPFGTATPVALRVAALVEAGIAAHGMVCLVGDSAGGQIALSVAQVLRDAGIRLPQTLLIAPALDLTWSNPRIPSIQSSDPWLAVPGSTPTFHCSGRRREQPASTSRCSNARARCTSIRCCRRRSGGMLARRSRASSRGRCEPAEPPPFAVGETSSTVAAGGRP